jgi:hypothetical protein
MVIEMNKKIMKIFALSTVLFLLVGSCLANGQITKVKAEENTSDCELCELEKSKGGPLYCFILSRLMASFAAITWVYSNNHDSYSEAFNYWADFIYNECRS